MYDKETKDRKVRNEAMTKLSEYIATLNGFMKYAEKYDASSYDYVIEQGIKEDDPAFPKNVPYEQIIMSYYLHYHCSNLIKKLENILEYLKEQETTRKAIDGTEKGKQVNFEAVDKEFQRVCTNARSCINEFKGFLELTSDFDSQDDTDDIDFDPAENLVFCLDIDIDDLDENNRKELVETLKEHEEKQSWHMKKNPSSELKDKTKNAKNKTHIKVLSTEEYDAYRHRGTPNGRTGIMCSIRSIQCH